MSVYVYMACPLAVTAHICKAESASQGGWNAGVCVRPRRENVWEMWSTPVQRVSWDVTSWFLFPQCLWKRIRRSPWVWRVIGHSGKCNSRTTILYSVSWFIIITCYNYNIIFRITIFSQSTIQSYPVNCTKRQTIERHHDSSSHFRFHWSPINNKLLKCTKINLLASNSMSPESWMWL